MSRPLVASLTVAVALFVAIAPVAGATRSNASEVSEAAASPFLLRGRQQVAGPWKRYLWLKYSKFGIVRFSVCGAWNQPMSPTCSVAQGNELPAGATLKLEQRIGSAKTPTWRTVGVSPEPTLQAALSNTVSKNLIGSVSYRVTLRSPTNRIVRVSNVFKVFWTR